LALALLFPGQGSQSVGMGRDLARAFPEARSLFEEADDHLQFGLSRLMWEGPEAELTETRHAQPAILTHSIATLRVIAERIGPVSMAAGHSLGELSAHVAAGTLAFEEALGAVRVRGDLMYRAGQERDGTMAAVLGLTDAEVDDLCRQASGDAGLVVVPANLNAPGQVVVSGDRAAVSRLVELAPKRGAKRVLPLSVSGAFHSPLMEPAEHGFREHLSSLRFATPAFPVYSNVTAAAVTDGQKARNLLVEQLRSPVRWAESITGMVDAGADRFLEVGPGSVLTGLNRRIIKGVDTRAVGTPEGVEALT
jgi:[acyl-carrier-protein] S-malonyltransferase